MNWGRSTGELEIVRKKGIKKHPCKVYFPLEVTSLGERRGASGKGGRRDAAHIKIWKGDESGERITDLTYFNGLWGERGAVR